MASSTTAIANLAISHLGIGKEIANLETERSSEAQACRRFYETARDVTLRDFPWPFATKINAIGLVEEDPNDEWGFSYRYPTDCLMLRRILSGLRNDNRQSRIPYRVTRDDSGLLIYTDAEDAELEYTIKETDVGRFPADFTMAFSFLLAGYVAPRLTGGDPFKLGQRALELYQIELSHARLTAMNEEQSEELPDSEFIRTRE
jgi:hypothetical protein